MVLLSTEFIYKKMLDGLAGLLFKVVWQGFRPVCEDNYMGKHSREK